MAQWVKRWTADLVVPSLPPTPKENSTATEVSLHIAFHLPDMTEILLKMT